MINLNFQHHYSGLQCHMILQKSFEYVDLLLKTHFLLISMLKNIFVESDIFSGIFEDQKVKKNSIYLFFTVTL